MHFASSWGRELQHAPTDLLGEGVAALGHANTTILSRLPILIIG